MIDHAHATRLRIPFTFFLCLDLLGALLVAAVQVARPPRAGPDAGEVKHLRQRVPLRFHSGVHAGRCAYRVAVLLGRLASTHMHVHAMRV